MDAAISRFKNARDGYFPLHPVDTNLKESGSVDSDSFSSLRVSVTASPDTTSKYHSETVPETPSESSRAESDTSAGESSKKISLDHSETEADGSTIDALTNRLKQFRSTAHSLFGSGVFEAYDPKYIVIASIVRYLLNMLVRGWDHINTEMSTGEYKGRLAELDTLIRSTPQLEQFTKFVPDFRAALKAGMPDSPQTPQTPPPVQVPQHADQLQAEPIDPPDTDLDDTEHHLPVPRQLLPEHVRPLIKLRLERLSNTLATNLDGEMDAFVMDHLNAMRSKLDEEMDNANRGALSLEVEDLSAYLQRFGADQSAHESNEAGPDIIDPKEMIRFNHDIIDPQKMNQIRTAINDMQKECAQAWHVQHVFGTASIEPGVNRIETVQHLINALRAMRPVFQSVDGGQICAQQVSALLLLLAQLPATQSEAERNEVHRRINELNDALHAIGSVAKASLHFLKGHFVHLLELSGSLLSDQPPVATTGNVALLKQLLRNIQPLFSEIAGCEAGAHIITALILELQSRHELSNEDSLSIAARLDALLKSLNTLTPKFDANHTQVELIKTSVRYLQAIFQSSISTLSDCTGTINLKSDAGLLVMVKAIRASLTELRPDTAKSLKEIEERLSKASVEVPDEEIQQPRATPEKINLATEAVKLAARREKQRSRQKERAQLSYDLDNIVKKFQIDLPRTLHNGDKPPPARKPGTPPSPEELKEGKKCQLQFIKKNLAHLAFLMQARWAEKAHEAVVDELTDYYRKLWSMAYSNMKSVGIAGGFSAGALIPAMPKILDFLSAELGVTGTWGMTLDDENFPGRVTTLVASVAVKAGIAKILEGSLKGSISGYGKYEEWDTVRKYVLANFDRLINVHSGYQANHFPNVGGSLKIDHRPVVSAYLNRHAVLGKPSLARDWALLSGNDMCRVDRIEAIQQKYDNNYKQISQSFSLLLSSLGPQWPDRVVSTVELDTFKLDDGTGLDLTISTNSRGAALAVGAPIPVLGAHISAAAERSNSKVDLVVPTALCKKMAELQSDLSNTQDPYAEAATHGVTVVEDFQGNNEQRAKLLTEISEEILRKSKPLRAHWNEVQTILTGLAFKTSVENRALQAIRTADDKLPVKAQVRNLHKPPRYTWSHKYGATTNDSATASEFADLRGKLQILHRDLQEYTRFQAQKYNASASKTFIDAANESIKNFHGLYGAANSEDFLYRLLLVNAWLCVSLEKVSAIAEGFPDIAAQIKLFKKENAFENLEQAVLKPPFAIDRKKLLDLISVKKQASLTINDTKISIRANANFEIIDPQISKSVVGGVTVSRLSRQRRHTNPLRHGDSIDWEIRIGANVGITPDACQSLLTKLCKVHGIEDIPNVQQGLATYLADQPHLVSTGYERTFTFRWYKPSEELFPGLRSRRFYFRQNNVTAFSFAPKLSFGFGASAGVSFENNATWFGREEYYPDTIWYFLQRFFHDYGNNHIPKANHFDAEGYWLTIAQQQKPALMELFKKFATESEARSLPASPDSLTMELNVIEDAFKRRKISHADLHTIQQARTQFNAAAVAFSNAATAEKYEAALIGFQNLLYAYCPHIKKMKTNSLLFTTMEFSLPDIRSKSANIFKRGQPKFVNIFKRVEPTEQLPRGFTILDS